MRLVGNAFMVSIVLKYLLIICNCAANEIASRRGPKLSQLNWEL